MILDYLLSGEFYETASMAIIGTLLLIALNAFDKKYLKTKSSNTSWYHSAKGVLDAIRFVIVIICILTILSINGVSVGKYVASLGIAGVVASFALQDFLKDLTMGISIMFEGYYKPGDVIIYQGRAGKVISFNIKTTKLFMIDDESTMSICNRNIDQVAIDSDWLDLTIPIGYDADIYYSRYLCKEVAKRIERLRYVYSCDFINTQELAESWIEYRLRIHCQPEKKPAVRRAANAVLQDVFYENDMEFPLSIKVIYNMDYESLKDNRKTLENISDAGSVEYKKTYELGRGAEKSKTIMMNGSDISVAQAANEAERYARSENLDKKKRLQLRLVTEEVASMVKRLADVENGRFYITRESEGYEICYDADATVSHKSQKELVEMASSGTNDAYLGLGGVITKAVDAMLMMEKGDKPGFSKTNESSLEKSISKQNDDINWSYSKYRDIQQESAGTDSDQVDWEDVGRNVITNVADDIRISVKARQISMRIFIKNAN